MDGWMNERVDRMGGLGLGLGLGCGRIGNHLHYRPFLPACLPASNNSECILLYLA